MKFEDLKKLYLQKKKQFGANTYKYVSQLLKEAKEFHKKDWSKHPTPGEITNKVGELSREKIWKN